MNKLMSLFLCYIMNSFPIVCISFNSLNCNCSSHYWRTILVQKPLF